MILKMTLKNVYVYVHFNRSIIESVQADMPIPVINLCYAMLIKSATFE